MKDVTEKDVVEGVVYLEREAASLAGWPGGREEK